MTATVPDGLDPRIQTREIVFEAGHAVVEARLRSIATKQMGPYANCEGAVSPDPMLTTPCFTIAALPDSNFYTLLKKRLRHFPLLPTGSCPPSGENIDSIRTRGRLAYAMQP